MLWERVADPACRARVDCLRAELGELLPAPGDAQVLHRALRQALAAALQPAHDTPLVVIARAGRAD